MVVCSWISSVVNESGGNVSCNIKAKFQWNFQLKSQDTRFSSPTFLAYFQDQATSIGLVWVAQFSVLYKLHYAQSSANV